MGKNMFSSEHITNIDAHDLEHNDADSANEDEKYPIKTHLDKGAFGSATGPVETLCELAPDVINYASITSPLEPDGQTTFKVRSVVSTSTRDHKKWYREIDMITRLGDNRYVLKVTDQASDLDSGWKPYEELIGQLSGIDFGAFYLTSRFAPCEKRPDAEFRVRRCGGPSKANDDSAAKEFAQCETLGLGQLQAEYDAVHTTFFEDLG